MNQKSVSDRNGAEVEQSTIVGDKAAELLSELKPHRRLSNCLRPS